MGGSWKVARLAGVDVFLHWTFLLFIGWIFVVYLTAGQSWTAAWMGVAFTLSIFGCVMLHELGHALAARMFGVPTQDITILPIGGVARLKRIPEHPLQECIIAIAGPVVNVLIAAVLAVIIMGLSGLGQLWYDAVLSGHFLQNLMWANIALVIFNLIPAFPMDGGRMFRAFLALFLDHPTATRIAAGVGQLMAVLFAVAGLFGNPMLLFIALFIYLGAAGEAQIAEIRTLLRGIPVRAAMMTRFWTLSPEEPLSEVAHEFLASMQQDFPVVDHGRLVGMLRRTDLAKGLEESSGYLTVADVMSREFPVVSDTDLLDCVMEEMQQSDWSVVPVLHGNRLVGLINTDNIGKLLMLRSALGIPSRPNRMEQCLSQ